MKEGYKYINAIVYVEQSCNNAFKGYIFNTKL